ncbi:MAG: hypothetical protein GTN49_11430 [candidate division Zixibacteria bacterium]|nr:hypothetical protein [candidate division Zixibacteria bacterium]
MKKVMTLTTTVVAAAALAGTAYASGKVVVVGARAAANVAPWRGASGNAMRFQCLWFQRDINYAGYVNAVEFEKSNSASGRFLGVLVLLCHTKKVALEATFNNNYTGYTPVEVLHMRSFGLNGTGWYDLRINPDTFKYNNSDNLLMEIRWSGDEGHDVPCWRSSQPYSRCYAYDYNASQGTVYNNGQRVRLTIGTMAGLEPTSLGRVRALFR